MSEQIVECGINFLSYDRALTLVPPEFVTGYEWYQAREGETFAKLPHRDDTLIKPDEIKICADRGIHGPDYKTLGSKGAGKSEYALCVHAGAAGRNAYDDKSVVMRDDGTWILDYCAHRTTEGKRHTENGNKRLMNNLADGVPVAVLVQQPGGGYFNYGLAYVERFDMLTGVFTLHGPVSAEAAGDFCSIIPRDQLTPAERRVFEEADAGDQRKRVVAEQIRRERQGEFRKMVVSAYEGACAVTGTNVLEVLQAAHIDAYRGGYSQVVTNGMLLRSDIHLLYDSHLITVMPDSNLIKVSHRLESSPYGAFDGRRIAVPKDPKLRPDDYRLELHCQEFESIECQIA